MSRKSDRERRRILTAAARLTEQGTTQKNARVASKLDAWPGRIETPILAAWKHAWGELMAVRFDSQGAEQDSSNSGQETGQSQDDTL